MSESPKPSHPESRTSTAGTTDKDAFLRAAAERPPSLVGEFVDFLKYNKKWWLLPILLVLGMVGVLAILATTGAAPFIYTIF